MKEKQVTRNDLLRKAREEKGWTQSRLAQEIGLEAQTVRSWERGIRTPSLESRAKLSDVFGKTPQQLGLLPVEETAQEPSTDTNRPQNPSQQDQGDENRQRMLQRVRVRWISFLERSLNGSEPIALQMQEQPDAVENPWRLEVQETDLPPRTLPEGTRITQVYDLAGGELLILGEPGAGKTTLLLELARDLLARADNNVHYPIPVLFHLSSWAERRQSLTDWLTEELNSKYQVPRKLGHSWIAADQILPLLDGLDEVDYSYRSACIEAINFYRREHGMVSMAVSSRSSDYFAQPVRILLHIAVVVQPLTSQQIDEYVARSTAEGTWTDVRQSLLQDPALRVVISTPLILSIVAQTYPGISEVVLPLDPSEQRRILFEQGIERLLQRGSKEQYQIQQTKQWLAWLAHQLSQYGQTEFYVERIQPYWLDNQLRETYHHRIVQLIFGVEVFISAALFAWLRGGQRGEIAGVSIGLLGALGSGPGNTILEWMSKGLGGGLEGGGSLGIIFSIVSVLVTLLAGISPLSKLSLWRGVRSGLANGLKIGGSVGLFSGLLFGLSGGIKNGVYRGLGTGLFSGLLIGLMTGLLNGLRSKQSTSQGSIHPVGMRYRLLNTLIFSVCAGLGNGCVYTLLIGQVNRNVIIYGLIIGLFYGLAFGAGGGTDLIRLDEDIRPAEQVAWSWKSVRTNLVENLKKGLSLGLTIMVPVIVILGLASAFFYGVRYGMMYGLVFGPIIGLIGSVASILTGMIRSGWSSNILDKHDTFRPNEGIIRSARNAVFAATLFGMIGGVASGLICGLAFGLVGGLTGWPILGAGFALIFGIFFALQFALIYGGIACIEHYILRWLLWRRGRMPWNYVRFLDYAAEHILLRKVGGGYIFSHRLVQDYFASLDS